VCCERDGIAISELPSWSEEGPRQTFLYIPEGQDVLPTCSGKC
jgi:hypothetical protein